MKGRSPLVAWQRRADDRRVDSSVHEPGRREVALRRDATLTVRPVTASDTDGLVALYEDLSIDDRHRRFFSGFVPPRSFFDHLVAVADRGGYGLVATVRGTPVADARDQIVGEASYELLPSGDGELGMVVSADQRGWLGPYLLDALIEVAASRGVPNLEADVLVTNGRMLALLRSRGAATIGADDWSVVRLLVGTAGRTPVWPGGNRADGRRRVLIEVPGGRWHAWEDAEEAGLELVACGGPSPQRRSRCPVLAGQPCPLAAEADAIVVSNVPDEEQWRSIVRGHADLHPGVPVCVEVRRGVRGAPGLAPETRASVEVVASGDPHLVEIVDRLATRGRTRAVGRTASDGRIQRAPARSGQDDGIGTDPPP